MKPILIKVETEKDISDEERELITNDMIQEWKNIIENAKNDKEFKIFKGVRITIEPINDEG